MASGQQLAEENFLRFTAWAVSKTDRDFRDMTTRGVLSRTEIAAECCFAKSALTQNPRVRDALKRLEEDLRERGVLPQFGQEFGVHDAPPSPRPADSARAARDAERLSRLELENASLKAENGELRRLLERFSVLQEVLAETGRFPR